jgi:uncharacterized protein (TIGR03545 family)/uncharacterized protein (TIGR03546 family)
MQFFLKLFKALNSAQTPWQVTLAIALGMVAGLTPMFGLLSIVVVFLAFVLNIHLGLFFVVSALFAGIGYLLDPVFEQIGYAVLASEGLKGFWTAWYNNGLLRITQFNNTLVMGSTLVSLVLVAPLYFVLGWAINHYRQGLAVLLGKAPKLGFLGILKTNEKRDPLVRWWGAGVFAVFAGLVAVFALVLVDPLAKAAIEKGASDALQRDVRVAGVNVSFSEGAITVDRVEVASETPGVDMVSVGRAAVDIDLGALLFNRTHIEDISITGVGFDTPETMKKRPAPPASVADSDLSADDNSIAGIELPTPESLLASADLQTVAVYKKAEAEIQQMIAKWQGVAQGDALATSKLDELRADLAALQEKSDSGDPTQMLALAKDVKAFQEKISTYKEDLGSIKTDFNQDRARIQALYVEMQEAKDADYEKLKSAYEMSTGGVQGIVGAIFEQQLQQQVAEAARYYEMIAPYLQSDPKPPVPPRGEGRWIKYPMNEPSPDLWVANTVIDGTLKGQSFSAKITDISDHQKHLGRPIQLTLRSDGPQISELLISAEDNRLGDKVANRINFSAAGFSLEPMQMESLQLESGVLAFNGNITLDDMTVLGGTSAFSLSDTKVGFADDSEMMGLAGDVLSSIDAFSADIDLGGTLLKPSVGVATDLDGKIAEGLGAKLSEEASAYSRELSAQLNGQVGDQLGSLKGSAGNIIDINKLLGERTEALTDLSSSAGSLGKGKGGSKIKKLFGF